MNQPKVKYSLSNWDLVTVNPNYNTWDWKDIFCFWGVNVQSIIGFSLLASLYTLYSLNTFVVFFGTILKRYSRLLSYILLIIAALIAYSRVYIGVHFPLDIFCGTLFGSFVGYVFHKLWKRFTLKFLDET